MLNVVCVSQNLRKPSKISVSESGGANISKVNFLSSEVVSVSKGFSLRDIVNLVFVSLIFLIYLNINFLCFLCGNFII